MAPAAGVGRHGRQIQSMISSHELQQRYSNGRNCGHKKSPSRMPVELLCVKRRGGKRTQPNGCPKAGPVRFVSTFRVAQPDTQASRLLCRASISNYGMVGQSRTIPVGKNGSM